MENSGKQLKAIAATYLLSDVILRGSSGSTNEWKDGVNLLRKLSGLDEKKKWQGLEPLLNELAVVGLELDLDAWPMAQVGTTGVVLLQSLLVKCIQQKRGIFESHSAPKTVLSHVKVTSGKIYFEVKILHLTPLKDDNPVDKRKPWMHIGWAKSGYQLSKDSATQHRSRRKMSQSRFVVCGSKSVKYWQGKKERYGEN